MSHPKKRRFLGLLTGIVAVATLAAALFHSDRLLRTAATWLADRDRVLLEGRTGEVLEGTITVYRGGESTPARLNDVLEGRELLMLWSPTCPPCASALDAYIAYEAVSPTAPPLVVLSIDAAATAPVGIPADRFLRPASSLDGTILDSGVTPVFLEFDGGHRLRSVKAGFNRAEFIDQLKALSLPVSGG